MVDLWNENTGHDRSHLYVVQFICVAPCRLSQKEKYLAKVDFLTHFRGRQRDESKQGRIGEMPVVQ